MAVPKRRTSTHKKGLRRAHHALGKPNLKPCANCGAFMRSHRVCPSCGYYKGSQVLVPKVKKIKEAS